MWLAFSKPTLLPTTAHSMWCLASKIYTNSWLILTPWRNWQILANVSSLPTHSSLLEKVAVWLMLSMSNNVKILKAYERFQGLTFLFAFSLSFQYFKQLWQSLPANVPISWHWLKELVVLGLTISVQYTLFKRKYNMLNTKHNKHLLRMYHLYLIFVYIIYLHYFTSPYWTLGNKIVFIICSSTSGNLWHCFLFF